MKAITFTQHSAEQTYGNGKTADGHHLLASNTTNSDSAQSANSLIDGIWFMDRRVVVDDKNAVIVGLRSLRC